MSSSPLLILIALVTLISIAFITASGTNDSSVLKPKRINNSLTSSEQKEPINVENNVTEVVEEIPIKKEDDKNLNEVFKDGERDDDIDIPNVAFPTSFVENDPESELASAYTYNNLQESYLTSRSGKDSIRTRNAWSRLGARNNDLLWNTQMNALKKQIEESGLTYEQFMEQSLTPIPEQFADFWKENQELITGELKTVSSSSSTEEVPKEALSEAASLVQDSTQNISTVDEKAASRSMQQIIDARKRAKKLGLKVPEITDDQKKSLNKWSENTTTEGLVKAVESLDNTNIKKQN